MLDNVVNTLFCNLTIGFEPLIPHKSDLSQIRGNDVSAIFLLYSSGNGFPDSDAKMPYFEAVFGASSHESSHEFGSHEFGSHEPDKKGNFYMKLTYL